MKRSYLLFCLLVGAFLTGPSVARKSGGSVNVRGYSTKTGKYVAPYFRNIPDRSKYNNWSTKGNINPYTGKQGWRKIK
ncbi:MAG: hypothetical protein EXR74_10095 [Bdellovibrionales bacterium]|nr:hypothetical protein [Bdellovibrionales bacterium]